jgi:ssDNA-binding Zn-finger/Zn-ribbon topoisomerase 1
MTALPCPDCGAPLVLKVTKYGKFYGCSNFRVTGCRGSHSAHQETGEPMGTPARAEVRAARMRAHRAFDELWTHGHMTRSRAYKWMQKVMVMTKRDAHIAKFDLEQCERLVAEVQRLRKQRPEQ